MAYLSSEVSQDLIYILRRRHAANRPGPAGEVREGRSDLWHGRVGCHFVVVGPLVDGYAGDGLDDGVARLCEEDGWPTLAIETLLDKTERSGFACRGEDGARVLFLLGR